MSESGTASADVRKIPFWRTIFHSFRFVFTNLHRVVTIGWLPFIIIVVASYVEGYAVAAEILGVATINAELSHQMPLALCPLMTQSGHSNR